MQHALKNSQNQAGYNSQRQVSHINDGTWTAKMNVNTVNPYLPHGVEYARQSAHLPKHLQVQDASRGATQSQWATSPADHAHASPQPHEQRGQAGLHESQAWGGRHSQHEGQDLRQSTSGSILNATRGTTLAGRDYPIILDGEVVIADGTIKPAYIPYAGPTVGYTGHGRRIAADNIYGATFANARSKAEVSKNRLIDEREHNVVHMAEALPKLKADKHTH